MNSPDADSEDVGCYWESIPEQEINGKPLTVFDPQPRVIAFAQSLVGKSLVEKASVDSYNKQMNEFGLELWREPSPITLCRDLSGQRIHLRLNPDADTIFAAAMPCEKDIFTVPRRIWFNENKEGDGRVVIPLGQLYTFERVAPPHPWKSWDVVQWIAVLDSSNNVWLLHYKGLYRHDWPTQEKLRETPGLVFNISKLDFGGKEAICAGNFLELAEGKHIERELVEGYERETLESYDVWRAAESSENIVSNVE